MHKVLLVLESESFRDLMQQHLQGSYEVLACGDAAEGAKLLREQPDALIADLFLPGTDGLTFLTQTSERHPPVILALTRLVNEEIMSALHGMEIDAVFLKPCSLPAVSRCLDRFLGKYSAKTKKTPLP